MKDCDGAAKDFIEGPERGEGHDVIAAEGEDFRFREGRVIHGWSSGAEFAERGCHLLQGDGTVKGRDGNVTAVEDGVAGSVGV